MEKRTDEEKIYNNVHQWIRNNYGKATECTNPDCEGKSTTYDWALLDGKLYEKNIENFHQLCRSCHVKYDWTEERSEYFRKRVPWNKGMTGHISEESRKKMGMSSARKCINIETGKIYDTLKEACIDSNQKYGYTNQRLNGYVPNTKTNKIRYYEKNGS